MLFGDILNSRILEIHGESIIVHELLLIDLELLHFIMNVFISRLSDHLRDTIECKIEVLDAHLDGIKANRTRILNLQCTSIRYHPV